MKTKVLYFITVVLFIGNIMLFGLIYYKTNLVQHVGVKLGVIESKPIDRPDYWCIRGWNNTLKKMNVDFDVVFFGNSITCGSSFHEYFPDISICNLGYPGDALDGMMLRVEQIKAVNPKKVFIMAGINGLQYQTLNVFKNKYERLVKAIKTDNPETKVYLQSILPVNNELANNRCASNEKINDANAVIMDIANDNDCVYVNVNNLYIKDGELDPLVTKDGVHLLPDAYDKWADLLKLYIKD